MEEACDLHRVDMDGNSVKLDMLHSHQCQEQLKLNVYNIYLLFVLFYLLFYILVLSNT